MYCVGLQKCVDVNIVASDSLSLSTTNAQNFHPAVAMILYVYALCILRKDSFFSVSFVTTQPRSLAKRSRIPQ